MSKPNNWELLSYEEQQAWKRQEDELEAARMAAERNDQLAQNERKRREKQVRSLQADIDGYQEQIRQEQEASGDLQLQVDHYEELIRNLHFKLNLIKNGLAESTDHLSRVSVHDLVLLIEEQAAEALVTPKEGDTDGQR